MDWVTWGWEGLEKKLETWPALHELSQIPHLDRMLDSGLLNFANEVAEVGDRAGKEYGLEKTLNKMKARNGSLSLWAVS